MNPGFPDTKTVPLNCSAHSVFAKQVRHVYLIRFSELDRETDDRVGRKAGAAERRVRDYRDLPPGKGEHKWGLHTPKGFTLKVEVAQPLLASPELPAFTVSLPREWGRQVQGRAITLPACGGKQRVFLLLLELHSDRWRAIC